MDKARGRGGDLKDKGLEVCVCVMNEKKGERDPTRAANENTDHFGEGTGFYINEVIISIGSMQGLDLWRFLSHAWL